MLDVKNIDSLICLKPGDRIQALPKSSPLIVAAIAKKTAQDSMAKGSLSFYFASKFLPGSVRSDIYMLYQWCRFCDDAIDEMPEMADTRARLQVVEYLRSQTKAAFSGSTDCKSVFLGLAFVMRKNNIPLKYPMDLLSGMEDDLQHVTPESLPELLDYCYKVAGTVGIMFSHIVGVRQEQALLHACQLGVAMQITNICRDVKDDAAIGRCYLPADLMTKHEISIGEQGSNFQGEQTSKLVSELISIADAYYHESEKGVSELPPRVAMAVLVARYVYASIGAAVVRAGEKAWQNRIWVPTTKKVILAFRAVGKFVLIYPWARQRFNAAPISREWRFECRKP